MRVVTLSSHGGPGSLRLETAPDPDCGPEEVIIGIAAIGMNYADLLQRRGQYGLKPGMPTRLGMECSGRVLRVGAEVTRFHEGDEVCALVTGGAYAERISVHSSLVLPKPQNIALVEAAALPEMAATVWSNLIDIGQLRDSHTVLVHGGAGGIGSGAIQIARAFGRRVFTTCGSGHKVNFCMELGATLAINYQEQDFVDIIDQETAGQGVDLILDNMSALYLQRNIEASAADARIVMIGLQGGRKADIDLAAMMQKRLSLHVTSLRDRPRSERARILSGVETDIWPLVHSGATRPIVDRVFSLDDVVQAHAYAEEGSHAGKILLQVTA